MQQTKSIAWQPRMDLFRTLKSSNGLMLFVFLFDCKSFTWVIVGHCSLLYLIPCFSNYGALLLHFNIPNAKKNEPRILQLLPIPIKTAKYEIQKPWTCHAALLPCKFKVDVLRFFPCVINKNICCRLKKCSPPIGWFAWCGSKMAPFVAWQVVNLLKNKQHSQNSLFKVDPCSTFRSNFLQPATNVFVARQVDHARWKTRNINPKLSTKPKT